MDRIRRLAGQGITLPLVTASALLPLIVRLKLVPIHSDVIQAWVGSAYDADFFSYWKLCVLLGCAVTAALFLWLRRTPIRIHRSVAVPLAVLVGCILVAAGLSTYPFVACLGFPSRYEGALTLISYAIVFVAATQIDSPRRASRILDAMLISSLIISVLGILQLLGVDPFRWPSVQKLILPTSLYAQREALGTPLGSQALSSTLYNPNYVGSYMAMLIPLTLGRALLVKSRCMRLVLASLMLMQLFALFGCQSRAGVLATVCGVAVLLWVLRRRVWCYRSELTVAAAIIVGAVLGLNAYTGGTLLSPLRSLLSEARAIRTGETASVRLVRVVAEGNSLICETTRETLLIKHVDGQLSVEAEDGHQMPLVADRESDGLRIGDPEYASYRLNIYPNNLLEVRRTGFSPLRFRWASTGFEIIDDRGRPLSDAHVGTTDAWDTLGSGRVYIWRRSIAMLLETAVVGRGPDTFALHFPQDELIAKVNIYGQTSVVIDKPHSLYLQTAIQTGVVSLLALLWLFAVYVRQSCQLYVWSEAPLPHVALGAPLFAAFCGYAVAAIFNDSVISVAPVFWVVLGLGIAVNRSANAVRDHAAGPPAGSSTRWLHRPSSS